MRVHYLILLLLLSSCTTPPSDKPGAGWTPLFNGRDLAGWTPRGKAPWTVRDGAIRGEQGGDPKNSGSLVTDASWKDFELTLEYRMRHHGKFNSGVFLRHPPGIEQPGGAYQANIGTASAGEATGALYMNGFKTRGDHDDSIRKADGWNRMEIRAEAAHFTVRLNGVAVSDYTDPAPEPGRLDPGGIGLQVHAGDDGQNWVEFRNIRIRPLRP